MLEKQIESKVTLYAKKLGWLSYKFTGQKSVPDRVYIKSGITVWVEFKRKGKKPTTLQAKTITTMREHGAVVYVIDGVDEGKTLFDEIERSFEC